MKDQLGICVDILFHGKWGRNPINGQLKSRSWWERRLKSLIDTQAITIPRELITDWVLADKPIPYEIEMEFKDQ